MKIHSRSMLIKSALSTCNFIAGQLALSELLVLNYHGTQKKFIPNFREQLLYLQDRFDIITPDTFRQYHRNTPAYSSHKPKLLLSFDDGIKNNLYAMDILSEFGLNAIFFIIPGFINTPATEQKKYFLKNIRPKIDKNIDQEPEDFQPLTWQELKSALNDGHGIGCHTYSHTLKSGSNSVILEHEIVKSKLEIAKRLSVSSQEIDCYCCPNETFLSTGKDEYRLIQSHYNYFFTSFAGSNLKTNNPFIVCRTNVEAFWPKGAFKYAVGKLDWIRWKAKINKFRKEIAEA